MRNLSVALFSIAWLAIGQSQPPAPTPGVVGKTEQQKKTDKNAIPKGSDQPPAPSTQPISPPETQKTKSESPKSAQSPMVINVSIPKSDINVADWLLVLFTAGLVGVGYLQWRILKGHHHVLKISARAAKSSADTLALQREVMNTQAGYIGGLLAETAKAADAARSSAETAKRALYISQRPVITVSVTMAGGMYELAEGASEMDKLSQSNIRVFFGNVGTTVARDFYFAFWITGEYGRHLISDSHRRPLAPGETVEESSKKLISFALATEIIGLTFDKTKICGFVRYKTLFGELPGVYIEFHAFWDKSIRQFRVTTEEKEDGGYPEPF